MRPRMGLLMTHQHARPSIDHGNEQGGCDESPYMVRVMSTARRRPGHVG